MTWKFSGALRVGALLSAFVVLAAMLGGPVAAADPTSGPSATGIDLEPLAVPGAPAPIRVLPICEQLQDPPTGACPVKSEYLTVSSSGSMDGSAAVVVSVSPTIPPCATSSYLNAPCYTQIVVPGAQSTLGAPRCEYLDDATGLLQPCLVPYQDTFAQWEDAISRSGTWRLGHDLEIFGCASVSNFSQYIYGGPATGGTWPELAALAEDCTMSMDRTPDNLMGASWVIVSGLLQVVTQGPDGPVFEVAHAETYVGVNGTLGPFADVTDPDPDPDPDPSGPFTDVPTSSFAHDDIALLFDLGITKGVNATEYGPTQAVTREQMAAFLARLWRALGNECPDGQSPFTDIATDSYAYDEAACIYALGITTGVSATAYDPSANVTREQMAAFLARMWRALGNDCASGSTGFTDVASTSFAAADIECIYHLKITTGTSATTYGPSQLVTREQMAAFLGRMYRALTT